MLGQDWAGIGIGFIIALVLALWSVINIVQSDRTSPIWKAVWVVFVLYVPYIGFLIWLFLGPRATKS